MRQKWTRRTPALEEEIYRRLAQGGSLLTISGLPGMPSKVSMVRWRRNDPVFRAMTDAARQAGAEAKLLGRAVLAGKVGGAEVYTPELGRKVCDLIMVGTSWRELMERRDLPHMQTVYAWLGRHPDFREAFTRAVQARAQVLGEEAVKIADEASSEEVSRARLRVEVRKWLHTALLAAKTAEATARKDEGFQSYEEALRELLKRRAEGSGGGA
jgi:hypothetical protein